MSVAVLVRYHPTGDVDSESGSTYLPLATEAVFRRVWQPIARDAGLIMIPQLGDGLVITDPYGLIAELETFAAALHDAGLDPAVRREVLDRIERLTQLLATVGDHPDAVEEIYVG